MGVTVGRNKFRSLKEVEDKLKFLENQRYKTTSAREDEQILNEMEALEKAKNGFASFQAQQEALNQDRQLQKGIQAKLDALRAQMNPLTTKEKELQNRLDKASNRNGDVKTKLRAKKEELGKENNAEYEEIAALLTQLKELNVEEKETRTKWEADRKEAQEKKKLEEEQRKNDLIKKYEEEYLKKHPYEVEMKICDQLLIYVEALITDLNKSNDLEATNANSSSTTSMKTNKTGFFDSDNEEEVIGKKKKNKKNKARAVKPYTLDIEMIPSFTRIKCEPPTKPDDFQKILEKIKEKKEWYTSQPLPSKVEITLDDREQPVVKYPDLPSENSPNISNESNGVSTSLSKSESQGSTGSKKSKKSAKLDVQSSEQFPSLGGN